jgi:hypothetical protein
MRVSFAVVIAAATCAVAPTFALANTHSASRSETAKAHAKPKKHQKPKHPVTKAKPPTVKHTGTGTTSTPSSGTGTPSSGGSPSPSTGTTTPRPTVTHEYIGTGTVTAVSVTDAYGDGTLTINLTSTNKTLAALLAGSLQDFPAVVGPDTTVTVDGQGDDLTDVCPGDTASVTYSNVTGQSPDFTQLPVTTLAVVSGSTDCTNTPASTS